MEREIQNVVDIVKLAKSVNKDALALLKLDEDYTYEPLPRLASLWSEPLCAR